MNDRKRVIGIGLAALMLCSLCAVCVSTGAMAAFNTNPLGGPTSKIDSAPAVVSTGDNTLTVYAKGADQLYKNSWDGAQWSGWKAIANPAGVTVSSNPAISTDRAGKVWVAARFSDSNPRVLHSGGTTWSPAAPTLSAPLFIPVGVSPALAFQAGTLHVFVVDNQAKTRLQEITYTEGGSWGTWNTKDLPTAANLEGSPSATAWTLNGVNRIDVFVPDGNNGMQQWSDHLTSTGPGWNNAYGGIVPNDVALAPAAGFGTYRFAPAVAKGLTPNRLDVFYTDTHGNCQQLYWNGQKWVTNTCPWPIPPKRVGDMTSGPSAVWWKSDGADRVDVFCRGTGDAYLWQEWWTKGDWQLNWKGGPGVFPALAA